MRRIAIVIFPGCQSLDVAGPLEVFHGATAALARAGAGDAGYTPIIVAPTAAPVRTESGLVLQADAGIAALAADDEPLDSVVIAGGPGVAEVARDPAFVEAFRRLARRAGRVASVCTGAFVLGAAGLLDDRRATTHWAYCATLAQLFPRARVESEPVYVHDGPIWSSAGVTAGMDLALALVERDLGPELATEVARWLVIFVRRAGAQPQVSAQLRLAAAERETVRELVAWIVDHPADELAVASLARRVAMSVRNFARVFRAETGESPARYVARVRLEAARRLLETTTRSVDEIAAACGFSSAEVMRRGFGRSLGAAPSHYRASQPRAPR